MIKGFRYFKCPDCGKRGVSYAMRPRQEDNYWCRYCPWYYFTLSNSQIDTKEEERFKEVNQDRLEEI
jgi:hypothetical protein